MTASAADTAAPGRVSSGALLCLAQSFAPDTTPTAIRAAKLLERLGERWDITVLTESQGPSRDRNLHVEVLAGRRPKRLFAALRALRLNKLLELLVWPDESIFWVIPAVLAGRRAIRRSSPSAIVVFMMPYSAGLAGILLSTISGLPLILNLDDSLTCTDMHPFFPTRFHYRMARALENLYARRADALVYVSQRNLDAVSSRQPLETARKLRLVRYGADPPVLAAGAGGDDDAARGDRFEVAYVGAMSGWRAVIGERPGGGPARRIYTAWTRLGRYQLTALDQRTSSPAIIGRAIIEAVAEHHGWAERVKLVIYGDPHPADVVARSLASAGVEDVVTVLGPVPHADVAAILARADLLFLALPKRIDGSPGGRISAKTYEYLMTDRPILAALPRGENWDYLADKPGVWVVEPDDRPAMKRVLTELAEAKFAGQPRRFARETLHEQLSYDTRAAEFEQVIRAAIEHRRSGS